MQPDPHESNPYASSTLAADAKDKQTPGFRPLAVLVGFLADIGFSLVVGTVVGMAAAIVVLDKGIGPERLQEEIQKLQWVQIIGLILGMCGTAFGGFIGAWMGRVRPLMHAFAVGVLSMMFGVVAVLLLPDAQPTWVSITGFAFTLPAALLGGLLRAAIAPARPRSPFSSG